MSVVAVKRPIGCSMEPPFVALLQCIVLHDIEIETMRPLVRVYFAAQTRMS